MNNKEFIAELERWQIHVSVFWGRLILRYGNEEVRKYYSDMFHSRPRMEADLILHLSKANSELAYAIEERAAIRQADGLSEDLFSAVLCNITY